MWAKTVAVVASPVWSQVVPDLSFASWVIVYHFLIIRCFVAGFYRFDSCLLELCPNIVVTDLVIK
jgi:hypothetical protein